MKYGGAGKVCAVVVTYHPEPTVFKNLRAIARQCDELYVVDNGSSADAVKGLQALAASLATPTEIIGNADNRGIAAALEQGGARALASGADWIATFDQDSLPADDMIASLLGTPAGISKAGDIAVLAPTHVDADTGARLDGIPLGQVPPAREVLTTLTSGNLVRAAAWKQVGGFDESLFIDYVDHDFCLRCRSRGFRIVEVAAARLSHSLGAFRRTRLLGLSVASTHHSALRRYYISRNRLVIWRRFMRQEPRWVVRDVISAIKETAKILLLEQDRRHKLRMTLRGVRDAFAGRFGKLEEPRR